MGKKNCWSMYRALRIIESVSHRPIRPEYCSEEDDLVRNEDWWKITLYNQNLSPIADGTTCFFTDDIEAFQKRWFLLLGNDANALQRKNNFLRSKTGEIVTEWYDDNPRYNIVQIDRAVSYKRKTVVLENITFKATNFWQWKSEFRIGRWEIDFRWISFRGEYYRIASFHADWVCRKRKHSGLQWDNITCYGNPVLENNTPFKAGCWN